MVEPKRRGLWFKLLIGFCVVVLIIAGWLFLERIRGQGALKKYEQELIAKGEKLMFVELIPPLPDGPNKGVELLGLCGSFQTGAVMTINAPKPMKGVAPGKAMVITKAAEWFEMFERKENRFTWEQVGQDLERNQSVLNELSTTVRSPAVRFPIQYRGIQTMMPHLSRQKVAAQWLSGSALYKVRTKDLGGAIDDIESILMLAGVTEHEPFLISQLVRNALIEIAVHNCWPLLQYESSDAELLRLQNIFSAVDAINPMVLGLQGERAMARDTFDMIRSAQFDIDDIMGTAAMFGDDDEAPRALDNIPYGDEMTGAIRQYLIYPAWRFAFSYEDERHAMEEIQRIIDAMRTAKETRSTAQFMSLEAAFDQKGKPGGDYRSWKYLVTGLLAPASAKVGNRVCRTQAHCEIVVAAVALKRHHMRHKRYPGNLDELVPEFVPRIPIDYMDGKPLRYRLDGDQFVLWSIGTNGKDDGGTPKSKPPFGWMLGPDDVWPRAASEEEVAAHRESQKKR